MNAKHSRLVCIRLFQLFLPLFTFLVPQARASDCATYTAPLSIPVTTEDQRKANVMRGNQTRLEFSRTVALAPYRYDDAVELLERIEETILPHLPPDTPAYNFEFFVVDRAIEGNYASAWDGGPIRVSEKLIIDAESVDVLAYAVTHEMGHIIHQHTMRYFLDVQGVAIDYWARLQADVKIRDPVLKEARDKERIAKFDQFVNSETFVLTHERESDIFAAHVATRAGYSPELMARFHDRMAEKHGGKTFPTHPQDVERATLLRCFLTLSSGPAHEDLDAQFHAVQDRLLKQRLAIEAATQNK